MTRLLHPHYWAGHLLALAALSAAVLLGLWQYDAWSAHREAAAAQVETKAPVPLSRLLTPDSPFTNRALARQVTFTGSPTGQFFYVADRPNGDRTGYWVLTPVVVDGSALPVVLGWSSTKAQPSLPSSVEVTGWLQPTESTQGIDEDPSDNVFPQLRIASLTQHIDMDLYGGFVLAKHPRLPGLSAIEPLNTPKVGRFNSLRNLLYSIQWWIFGALAVYIWWKWCQDQLNPEGAADA